jgi:hypothetical protein
VWRLNKPQHGRTAHFCQSARCRMLPTQSGTESKTPPTSLRAIAT